MEGKFCASTFEGEEDENGFSNETIKAAFFSARTSHLGDSPHCSDVFLHDVLRNAAKPSLAQEETSAMLSPSESTNCCGFGLAKRPKIEQSGLASKAQMSQNQVRKLGEKITALQQLVSPFGKTDTASVLLEAIGYIKFLQDQVHVLSSPYMKSNGNRKGGEVGTDLRSRGLCLVPVSCTLNVANSNGADYWISGISGCSR